MAYPPHPVLGVIGEGGGVVWVLAAVCTAVCVVLHYTALRALLRALRRHLRHSRRATLMGIVCVLALVVVHLVEASLFALSYHASLALTDDRAGTLVGSYDGSFADTLYFSLSVYTTVGFGDIRPTGALRALVGIESLVGLILITWSASFTFLLMQRYFKQHFDSSE